MNTHTNDVDEIMKQYTLAEVCTFSHILPKGGSFKALPDTGSCTLLASRLISEAGVAAGTASHKVEFIYDDGCVKLFDGSASWKVLTKPSPEAKASALAKIRKHLIKPVAGVTIYPQAHQLVAA